jgi:hypothetical protein
MHAAAVCFITYVAVGIACSGCMLLCVFYYLRAATALCGGRIPLCVFYYLCDATALSGQDACCRVLYYPRVRQVLCPARVHASMLCCSVKTSVFMQLQQLHPAAASPQQQPVCTIAGLSAVFAWQHVRMLLDLLHGCPPCVLMRVKGPRSFRAGVLNPLAGVAGGTAQGAPCLLSTLRRTNRGLCHRLLLSCYGT